MNKHNDIKTIEQAKKQRHVVQEAIARQGLGLRLTVEQKQALLRHKAVKAVSKYE